MKGLRFFSNDLIHSTEWPFMTLFITSIWKCNHWTNFNLTRTHWDTFRPAGRVRVSRQTLACCDDKWQVQVPAGHLQHPEPFSTLTQAFHVCTFTELPAWLLDARTNSCSFGIIRFNKRSWSRPQRQQNTFWHGSKMRRFVHLLPPPHEPDASLYKKHSNYWHRTSVEAGCVIVRYKRCDW